MKRIVLSIGALLVIGLAVIDFWPRFTIGESGHGFQISDQIVLGEYGYSDGGDRLRYAILRTWPVDSTPEERLNDNRVGRDFFGWPLIRDQSGRMIPAGTGGDVYFFVGDELKTLKVRMNEHTDTGPLDDLKSLDEVWAYFQRFRR